MSSARPTTPSTATDLWAATTSSTPAGTSPPAASPTRCARAARTEHRLVVGVADRARQAQNSRAEPPQASGVSARDA